MKTIPFSDVREYYQRMFPVGNWFDKSAMKFFGTKLPTVAFETTAGILFITSEQDADKTRRYFNVRRQRVSGVIEQVGKYNDFRTRAEAKNYVAQLDKGVG
jgi:hypothetical protein